MTARTSPTVSLRLAPGPALHLDPSGVLAVAVGLVTELRHDALKPLFLGRGEQLHRVRERFREAEHMVVRFVEQMAKHGVAFDERPPPQAPTVEFQQVEAPRAQIARCPIHQRFEVRLAVAVAQDNLSVDDG